MTVFVQIGDYNEITSKSSGNTNVNIQLSGSWFNSSNVRSAVQVSTGDDSTAWFSGPTFSATNLWIHYVAQYANFYTTLSAPDAVHSNVRIMAGGTQRFRLVPYSTTIIKLEKWTGVGWSVIGSFTDPYQNFEARHTYDIHATIGVSSTITVYLDNTVIIAATGIDTTFGGTVSAFDDVRFSTTGWPDQRSSSQFSEILCTDWNTIGSKVVVRVPDANGNYTQWANGDYTVVDEAYGGTDYATSATPDQRVDWSMGSFPATTGAEIIANVKFTTSINRDTVGPQNANYYIRRNSTDYDGADKSLNLLQTNTSESYTVDPATSDVWTIANLNAATFGVRSRT